MIGGILKKIVGSSNDRVLRSMNATLLKIGDLEKTVAPLSDSDLQARTAEFKSRVDIGEPLDSLLPEAFATVREASKRVLGMRHFDMQIIGGMVLHHGRIAEMRTGEGKTLVATLPAYLNALSGKGVHVVTVNDYLAQRDADWMGRLYRFLGLEVGVVFNRMPEEAKKRAYQADITYGQNNEIGFDYLRDNMKFSIDEMVQRGHNFAIVDEVDSILIDEARTPLIISGPAEDSSQNYYRANTIVPQLKKDQHYEVDLRANSVALNEEGITEAEKLLGVRNLYEPNEIELLHCLNQCLHAHICKERDVDYLVTNGQVIIVDEFTGRAMPGRRWSDGLHQAIEAKEGLTIARESQTLASITFQNLFRLYDKLSGMTGTAATEALEFKEIYNLDVVVIPTHRPVVRQDQSDLVFRSKREKYNAVCEDLAEIHKKGQPALVGTISIEQSEFISQQLTERQIPHQVLNAKQHEKEALIVAQAGRLGAVTIATNMAGRGTDIVLGGNPEGLARDESGTSDEHNLAYQEALKKYQEICSAEREQVVAAGGLFIMGTERHESRRIDNQLRGRSGRQGDPGCSRFYVSFEDDLMKRFHGERLQALTNRIGWEEGAALDGRLVSRSIESAQTKVERYHFEARKNVTEYDDVMNKQRQVVYNLRSRILGQDNLRDEILTMIEDLVEEAVLAVCQARQRASQWDTDKLKERFTFLCNAECTIDSESGASVQGIFDALRNQAKERFLAHVSEQQIILDELREHYLSQASNQEEVNHINSHPQFKFETLEQNTMLEALDHFWNLHLKDMDHLREGIGLSAYGQKNPKHEYQKEGFVLFTRMLERLKESIVRTLCYGQLTRLEDYQAHLQEEERRRQQQIGSTREEHGDPAAQVASNGNP